MTERELETLLALTDGMDNNTAVLVKRLCQSYAMAVAERDTVTKRMVRLEWQVSALIRALSACDLSCEHCMHAADIGDCEKGNYECKSCTQPCACKECVNGSNWSWKGADYGTTD